MRLERTPAEDKKNLGQAAELQIDLSEKESPFYKDVMRLIEMRVQVQLNAFEVYGETTIHILCDLCDLRELKAAYKLAKRHVQVQRKVGRGPMLVKGA